MPSNSHVHILSMLLAMHSLLLFRGWHSIVAMLHRAAQRKPKCLPKTAQLEMHSCLTEPETTKIINIHSIGTAHCQKVLFLGRRQDL